MEKLIRAFIALEIPNNDTLDQVIEYQTHLQKCMGPLKLVKRELMHITSVFLGNIPESDAILIYKFLESEINNKLFANEANYSAAFEGVGDFRKQAFFIKIQNNSEIKELLNTIHNQINIKLRDFPNIKKETREYKPHLTIARAKRNRSRKKYHDKKDTPKNPGQQLYAQLKQRYKNHLFGSWTIKRVVLKKSVLTPQGPFYSNLEY